MKYKLIHNKLNGENKLIKYVDIKCVHIVTEELIADETNQNEFDTNLFNEHNRSIQMSNWLIEHNMTVSESKHFVRYHEMFCIDWKDQHDDYYTETILKRNHCRICQELECIVHR